MSRKISIKVPNAGQRIKLDKAVDDIRAHYGALLTDWQRMPASQRTQVLLRSPTLARLLYGVV